MAVQWGMSEALVVQSLKNKRSEIHGRIAAYEAQIAQARHDLAHVNATIPAIHGARAPACPLHGQPRLLQEGRDRRYLRAPSRGGWRDDNPRTRRESHGRAQTRRLDTTLRNSVVFKVVQALRHARRRKLVRMVEKRKGMCVWAAGDAVTLRVVASSPSRSG